jgi:hypothetical protein
MLTHLTLTLLCGLAPPADAPTESVPNDATAAAAEEPADAETTESSASSAESTEAPTESAEGNDSPLEEAERLFTQGVAKYETFDYLGAIELWTQAYALVPRTAETTSVRTDLVYNLSQAHVKQFGEGDDPVHLTRAQRLLERYIEDYEAQHPDRSDDGELADAQRRVDEVRTMLAEYEARTGDASEPRGGGPLLGIGIGLAAAGGVGLGVMGAGMGLGARAQRDVLAADTLELEAERISAIQRGNTANTLAIVGGVAGGALLVSGAVLIGIAAKRKRGEAEPRVTRVSGWATPKAGGVVWAGRF